MSKYIVEIQALLFFGFIFVIQPFCSWLAARWLVRRWVLRSQPALGWLVGLGSLAGVYGLGLLGIFLQLDLSRKSCGSFPTCCEYCGLSILLDYASGGFCLIIFLVSAIRATRQPGRVNQPRTGLS
jgi:hypothetical protein